MVPDPAKLDEIFDAVPGEGDVRANVERTLLRLLVYFLAVMPVFVKLVSHPAFDLQEFMKGHDVPAMQMGARLGDYLAGEAMLGRVREDHIRAATGLLINAIHNYALMACLGSHDRTHKAEAVAGAVAALWTGMDPC